MRIKTNNSNMVAIETGPAVSAGEWFVFDWNNGGFYSDGMAGLDPDVEDWEDVGPLTTPPPGSRPYRLYYQNQQFYIDAPTARDIREASLAIAQDASTVAMVTTNNLMLPGATNPEHTTLLISAATPVLIAGPPFDEEPEEPDEPDEPSVPPPNNPPPENPPPEPPYDAPPG